MPTLVEKKFKNIHIIINPAAGKSEAILPVINKAMKEFAIKWEVSVTHKAGDGIAFAKAAAKTGVDAIAVYGGDGTLMEAISGLMGSDIPLIILPGGSANILAKELGIPDDLGQACALISRSPLEIKTVDVGQLNKRYFIVRTSIGFEADMIKGTDRETKNRFGKLAYVFSAAAAFMKIKTTRYHISIDGKMHDVKGVTCIVANAGNLGFSKISLDKHIDISDGLLDVIVVRKTNFRMIEHIIATLLKRSRPDNLELVEHWQGKDINISLNRKQVVQCDGEVLGQVPLHIKVIPGAIRVLVPKIERIR